MGGESALIPYALPTRQSGVSHMAYQTSHFPSVSALTRELHAMGFTLDFTTDYDTTFESGKNTVIVDFPDGEVFETITVHLICDKLTVDLLIEALRLRKAC